MGLLLKSLKSSVVLVGFVAIELALTIACGSAIPAVFGTFAVFFLIVGIAAVKLAYFEDGTAVDGLGGVFIVWSLVSLYVVLWSVWSCVGNLL